MYGLGQEPDGSFVAELARRVRAHGALEAWDGLSEREALAPFLAVQRRGAASDDDGEADACLRIELFHDAAAAVIEARSGIRCSVMLRLRGNGSGRVIVVAGRLVVASRVFRGAQRFGFETLADLAEAGERMVRGALDLIARYPGVARQGA
jgi:probable nitrogen fixation protein